MLEGETLVKQIQNMINMYFWVEHVDIFKKQKEKREIAQQEADDKAEMEARAKLDAINKTVNTNPTMDSIVAKGPGAKKKDAEKCNTEGGAPELGHKKQQEKINDIFIRGWSTMRVK